jgi:hypothetical protein
LFSTKKLPTIIVWKHLLKIQNPYRLATDQEKFEIVLSVENILSWACPVAATPCAKIVATKILAVGIDRMHF